MIVTVFDTETTGLYKKNNNLAAQPHVVQLAAQMYDDKELVKELKYVLNYNIDVPEGAARVHGLTREIIDEIGVEPRPVWDEFSNMILDCDRIVAHNSSFDGGMVGVSCLRDSMPDLGNYFKGTEVICTMMSSMKIVNLPNRWGGVKWPKLIESHEHFFGESFDGAHDAMVDTKACARIYFHLLDKGIPLRGGV